MGLVTIESDKGKDILTGIQRFHCMSHLSYWSFSFLALYFGLTCEPSFLTSVFDLWLFCFVLFLNLNAVLCAVLSQSVVTLCDLMDCSLPGSSFHGDSQGKNPGVGFHALLQGIFPTQGSNLCFLLGRQILYHWASWEAHECVCVFIFDLESSSPCFYNRLYYYIINILFFLSLSISVNCERWYLLCLPFLSYNPLPDTKEDL